MAARLIDERIKLIQLRAEELPRPIKDDPVAILHLIPHEAVAGGTAFSHDELPTPSIPGRYRGFSFENTLDGRATFVRDGGMYDPDRAYIYIDSEGWIEAVDGCISLEGQMTIGGGFFKRTIGDAYDQGRDALDGLELNGPFEVGLSVLSVKGHSFATKRGSGFSRTGPKEFRQDDIKAKPYTVKDIDASTGEAMKRAFNRV